MGGAFVMLDPGTPWTPPSTLLEAWVRRVVDDHVVVAGVLAVTDTVKEVLETPEGPVVGATHDRERLRRLVCLVMPRPVEADDLSAALAALRADHEVVLLSAPR